MNTDTMGVYGNYYLKRAIVAQVGLGANLPEDAIYPLNLADNTGKTLDGANNYTIHFDKGLTPPAQAFWSITLYDAEGFQVANPLNRFAVSSWMPLNYNSDGSLDLYFQNESRGRRSHPKQTEPGKRLAFSTDGLCTRPRPPDCITDKLFCFFCVTPVEQLYPLPGLEVLLVLKKVLDLLHCDPRQISIAPHMVVVLR
jgi:hypothetical protein